MSIQVTGKNLDLGAALRGYTMEQVEKACEKTGAESISAHVVIEKAHGHFATSCTVTLRSGLVLRTHGSDTEPYPSVDAAIERLEKRMGRYRGRLKKLHHAPHDEALDGLNAVDYVIRHEDGSDAGHEDAPAIVAETQTAIRELSVGDAVMEMDLADKAFLIFKNASNDRLNVVYRRDDGHIGWVDPGGILGSKDRNG
ncbi:MAG: ribosome-associated translation inhibitor RaiA [Alphaproteobacteria bacterium]